MQQMPQMQQMQQMPQMQQIKSQLNFFAEGNGTCMNNTFTKNSENGWNLLF